MPAPEATKAMAEGVGASARAAANNGVIKIGRKRIGNSFGKRCTMERALGATDGVTHCPASFCFIPHEPLQ